MPLPIITMDDDIIQIGSGVRAVWPEDFVHEALKGGGSPEQAERQCYDSIFILRLDQEPEAILLLQLHVHKRLMKTGERLDKLRKRR